MKIQRFEDLECWKKARELANVIDDLTDQKEFVRDFQLRDQIRDAAGSVMHNIAEGFDAGSDARFGIAQNSLSCPMLDAGHSPRLGENDGSGDFAVLPERRTVVQREPRIATFAVLPKFIRFLKIARRSASEVQSQLYLALDRKYITDD